MPTDPTKISKSPSNLAFPRLTLFVQGFDFLAPVSSCAA